jgi:hypothetical protein
VVDDIVQRQVATSKAKRDRDGIRRLDADIKKLQAKRAKLLKGNPPKPKATKRKTAAAKDPNAPYISPYGFRISSHYK